MDYSITGKLESLNDNIPIISIEYQLGNHRNMINLEEWVFIRTLNIPQDTFICVSIHNTTIAGHKLKGDNYPEIRQVSGNIINLKGWIRDKIGNIVIGGGVSLEIMIS